MYETFITKIESKEGKEIAKSATHDWLDAFNEKNLDQLLSSINKTDQNNLKPKCPVCNEMASKCCSKCRQEWYCSRKCQVKHWSNHKKTCNLIS